MGFDTKNLFYISVAVDALESKAEEVALNLLLDFLILKVDDLLNFFGFLGSDWCLKVLFLFRYLEWNLNFKGDLFFLLNSFND